MSFSWGTPEREQEAWGKEERSTAKILGGMLIALSELFGDVLFPKAK